MGVYVEEPAPGREAAAHVLLIAREGEEYHAGETGPETFLRLFHPRAVLIARGLFQELGRGSSACSVDACSVVSACEAVCGDIAAGCDLVVLSKFGRLEAERSGLSDAFAAGLAGGVPILTSVAPKFDPAWSAFAAPLFVMLPPRLEAVEAWWRGLNRQAA